MSRDTISHLGLVLEGAASITLDHSVTLDQRIRRLLRAARQDAGRDDRTALMQDWERVGQDWERVGDDMRKAISIVEGESVKVKEGT